MADLEDFTVDEDGNDEQDRQVGWNAPVLILSFDGLQYCVPAARVRNVMPYRQPARVPHASGALAGILQDRGRMLALVTHPAGESTKGKETPSRVVVCTTARGLLGLPASTTKDVRPLSAESAPVHGSLLDGPDGPVSFLDLEYVAGQTRSKAP